jgi:hypothetical protein
LTVIDGDRRALPIAVDRSPDQSVEAIWESGFAIRFSVCSSPEVRTLVSQKEDFQIDDIAKCAQA